MWPDFLPRPSMLPGAPGMRPLSPGMAPQLPAGAPRASFMQKLMRGLFPLPQGYEEMLTPDEMQQARSQGLLGLGLGLLEQSGPVVGAPAPSLGQALAHGLLRGRETMGNHVNAGLLADERMIALQRQQARQRIADSFPAKPNETREQTIGRLRGMMAALAQLGDMEGAAKLGEYLKSVDNDSRGSTKIDEVIGPDGKPAFGYIDQSGVRVLPGGRPTVNKSTDPDRLIALTNPATGKPEMARWDREQNKFVFLGQEPASSRDAAGTEGERKAAVLLEIAGPSSDALDAFDAPDRLSQYAGGKGLQEFISTNQQMLDLHAKVVADAYIRLTSGANAPETEYARAFSMIAPRAGDSISLLQEKRAIRKRFLRALQIGAGRAASRVTPRKTESKSASGNRLLR